LLQHPELSIRWATSADLTGLAGRTELTLCKDGGLVAEVRGEIVAYLQWHPLREAGQTGVYVLSRLEVLKGFRGRGYGRRLIAFAKTVPAISTLIAEGVMWEAVPFVEKMGFVSDGTLNVDDTFDDAGAYVWHRPGGEGQEES
jgi:GNAT superfamily N-acetyltransferase